MCNTYTLLCCHRFGSKRRGTRTGIIFNNQMSDFSQPHDVDAWGLPPAEANFIAPGELSKANRNSTHHRVFFFDYRFQIDFLARFLKSHCASLRKDSLG